MVCRKPLNGGCFSKRNRYLKPEDLVNLDEQPLVSVVISCYNYAEYIERCMQSVLGQSYANLEVIVVDDGSTDESLQVIRKVAETDPRILVISQENQGVAYSRNLGIEKSRGEMLLFVDADDQLLPDFVDKTVGRLRSIGEGFFVYTQYRIHGEIEKVSNCGIFSEERIKIRNFVSICALHWKKNLEGVRFDSQLEMDEDHDFILSVVKKGIRGDLLDEVLFDVNRHGNSRSKKGYVDLKSYRTRKLILKNHRDFYSKQERNETIYNAKLSIVRAIKNRRTAQDPIGKRLVGLWYVMRFSVSLKEWKSALLHVVKPEHVGAVG